MIPRLTRRLRVILATTKRAVWARDGNSTIEFVIWFPFFMLLFFTSFELSIYGMRSMLLERAVDLKVRELRLGISRPADAEAFKKALCEETLLLKNCMKEATIDVSRVDSQNWNLPTDGIACADRAQEIFPDDIYNAGGGGDLMLLRVCVAKDPFFGTTPFVMGLPRDASGAVMLTAVSTYVNEP